MQNQSDCIPSKSCNYKIKLVFWKLNNCKHFMLNGVKKIMIDYDVCMFAT